MKAVYVSGPYSAPTNMERHRNIERAREAALRVWSMEGVYAVCPHLNTQNMDGVFSVDKEADYEKFIEADLDLVARCDAILMIPGYRRSKGAMRELSHALSLGLKVFYEDEYQEIQDWAVGEILMGHWEKTDGGSGTPVADSGACVVHSSY